MEVLQILKYCAHNGWLNFTQDWLTPVSELASLELTQDQIDKLMAEGKVGEILSLVEEAQEVVAAETVSDFV